MFNSVIEFIYIYSPVCVEQVWDIKSFKLYHAQIFENLYFENWGVTVWYQSLVAYLVIINIFE